MRNSVRTIVLAVLVAALVSTTGVSPSSTSGDVTTSSTSDSHRVLKKYAQDTWKSFEAMVEPTTGLPSDNVGGDLAPASRSAYTSNTNIGAYLWSTVAARDIGLISKREARQRMAQTIDTVAELERHEPSGQFYNWYDPKTLEKLTTWPENGSVVKPFLSSVDNGWLATGLLIAARAEPALAAKANAIRKEMDFGCYYNPAENGGGQIRGGFWDVDPNEAAAVDRRLLRHGHRRLVHRPPLRRAQHRAADGVVPRHRGRPDPGQALLRHLPHLPADV